MPATTDRHPRGASTDRINRHGAAGLALMAGAATLAMGQAAASPPLATGDASTAAISGGGSLRWVIGGAAAGGALVVAVVEALDDDSSATNDNNDNTDTVHPGSLAYVCDDVGLSAPCYPDAPTTDRSRPGRYETIEQAHVNTLNAYRNDPVFAGDYAVGMVGAEHAYAYGAFGQDVTVAVIDGPMDLDHTHWGDRTVAASNNPIGEANDDTHGNRVTSIIAAQPEDNTGTGVNAHGIAPGANVFLRGVLDGDADQADVQQYAADAVNDAIDHDVPVINVSFGFTDGNATGDRIHTLHDRYANIPGSDTVVVVAAGNHGEIEPAVDAHLPEYDYLLDEPLEPHFLAVVSVDADGNIAPNSNQCGSYDDFCLAAPGDDVAVVPENQSAQYDAGTSYAAPQVSGGLALLLSRFPGISALEARERLLATADSSIGDADVFGAGLMDLEAAMEPVDGLSVTTASTVNTADSHSLAGTGLEAPASWGDAIARELAAADWIAFDALGAPFAVDLSQGVSTRHTPALQLDAWMERALAPPEPRPHHGPGLTMQPRTTIAGDLPARAATDHDASNASRALLTDAVFIGMDSGSVTPTQWEAGVFHNAPTRKDAHHPAGGDESGLAHGDTLGFMAGVRQRLGRLSVGLRAHWYNERGTAMGAHGAGGLGIDGGRHQLATLAATLRLTPGMSVRIYTEQLDSRVDATGVLAVNAIRARAHGATLKLDGLEGTDTLRVGVHQPLRADGVRVHSRRATGRSTDGTIQYETATRRLSPSGRTVEARLDYSRAIGKQGVAALTVGSRREHGHRDAGGERTFAALGLSRRF